MWHDNMKKFNRGQKGFTLWEVLLILVILGLISFIAIPNFNGIIRHVESEVNKSNYLKVERAVQLYYLDVGRYPDSLQSLIIIPQGEKNWRGPYLEEIPYDYKGCNSRFEVHVNGKTLIL